jgi:hypothetical protein
MEKYVFDLQSSDKIIVGGDIVIIDCFIPVSDTAVAVDGYFEESGDSFFYVFDYNDSVTVTRGY